MKTSLKTQQQGKSFFQPLLATLITLLVAALGANPALARGHGRHGGHRGHDRNFAIPTTSMTRLQIFTRARASKSPRPTR